MLKQIIADKADQQRAYESKHKYDPAKFNLDPDQIRKDCAFFYETFLPPLSSDTGSESA